MECRCLGGYVIASVVLVLSGCGGDDSDMAMSGPGENCEKTADCESDYKCINKICQQAGADCPGDQDCSGMECGPDPVCGEFCGFCDPRATCRNGECVDPVTGAPYFPPPDTWLDPTSGLTWQVTPTGGLMTWQEAKSHCANLELAGGGWNLPTVGELRSLIRGCSATEPGGSCNVEEGNCLGVLCRHDSCDGCSNRDGPGEGGMYWPDEVEGDCCRYWSSSPEDWGTEAWSVTSDTGSVSSLIVRYPMFGRCVR